ncbi:MAG: hypothetical protein F6K63_11895 [Moorea sp. SIO1G6]|uniref:hypothetical protein n=1 Tax=Moorena sp. SIO4E2 TaxID=2607826 RepID=UPI0013B60040|nr:hypothetical protein [Moorena sp. SIO4E2]NEQ05786.1 hypothetical protein [Moorena sp. SIO4E2]NET65043.1 hypothetical protein [Moorena sp. SIO1G6]
MVLGNRESGVGSGATRGEFNSPTESAPRESVAVRPVANLITGQGHRGSIKKNIFVPH